MSEPDSRLENWCRRLVEAFVEDPPDTGYAAKGNGKLASRANATSAGGEPASGGDSEAAGYAGGTEPESAEREDTPPSRELVQLIDDFQSRPSREVGAVVAATGEPLVPISLPPAMKTNIYRVTRRQFSDLYGVDAALARVEKGSISRSELVSMYLKSFRNILNYDLFELREHETYFGRFVGYCTYVLHDLLEALYSEKDLPNIVSIIAISSIIHAQS
jgi:hypothetical protein